MAGREYKHAYKSLKPLIEDIAKGEVDFREALREALKKEEIHILTLSKENVDRIHELIELELLTLQEEGKSASGFTAGHLEALGKEINPAVETGTGIDIEDKKWAAIESYTKLLNAHQPKDAQYDLGHRDHSIAILRLALLKEYYRFDTSSELRAKNAQRQKKLIDQNIAALHKIDRLSNSNLRKLQGIGDKQKVAATKKDVEELLRMAGTSGQIDITSIYEQTFSLLEGKGKIAIELELKAQNRFKGSLAAGLGKAFTKSFNDKFKKDPILNLLGKLNIFSLYGSPSFEQNVEDVLDSAFFGKKSKSKKQITKVRVSRRIPSTNTQALKLKALVRKRTQNLKTKIAARRKKKKFIIPTVTLKAIINESLAQFIKQRMGAPTDPAIKLRYQTGRFSESAILLTLNRQESGIYVGTYDFMQNPYGTFLPGGRLHTQQRDPRLYIEGAIRDIAQIVLKKEYKGIALEHN